MADYDAQPDRDTPLEHKLTTEQLEADDIDLHAGLTGIAGIIAGGRGVLELLSDVAEYATRAIPGVDGAGVTLVDMAGCTPRAHAWTATAPFVREIDVVQYERFDEGPCITCTQTQRATVSGSLGSDSRWPHFGGRVARMGVHSVLALPLLIDIQVIGAINAYAHDRDAFGDHAVQMGVQFAGPAAVSVYNAKLLTEARRRAEQLQQALASRAVIDQAIGILRSRSGGSAQDAFDRLTRMSQTENVKLRVVAERLVDEAVKRVLARRQD